MSDEAEARALALGLPESSEQDHHGMVSFRNRGKIFPTLPDDDHFRIMVDEAETHAAVAQHPSVCAEFYWGKRSACVVVTLTTAPIRSPTFGRLRSRWSTSWARSIDEESDSPWRLSWVRKLVDEMLAELSRPLLKSRRGDGSAGGETFA